MEMYSIRIKHFYSSINKVVGYANGVNVLDDRAYFSRMADGEIIYDAPLFDYFFLQSYHDKDEWEWKLQDVHMFGGKYPAGGNWFISDKLKRLLENLNLAKEYHFYPSKLLYKGVKLDYWIFHFQGIYGAMNKSSYIDFNKSIFLDEGTGEKIMVKDFDEYKVECLLTKQKCDYDITLSFSKMVLTTYVDFLPLDFIDDNYIVVSAEFKNAIQKAGIDGLEFSPLEFVADV